ncbi:nucleoside phosphorylase domain-containing protein [Aspergillus karnatakaensis]|uniref:nucleoside phosphorylase domain-containing protein n=1 Tax=Aspergillus karnatakaensis TaxID=1810916 RepID=UPI003CCE3740
MITLCHDDYTIGWICALPLEMAAAKAMLDEIHEGLPVQPNDHNAYTLGKIGKHNVVIACLPTGDYGTASASTVAMQLLSSFRAIRAGLLVGIGGGIPSDEVDIRLGDVVVGVPTSRTTLGGVVQYDLGKAVRDGRFERTGALNRPPQILATAVSKLQAVHQMEGSRIPSFVDEIGKKYPRMRDAYTVSYLQDRLFDARYPHVKLMNFPKSTCSKCKSTRLINRPARSNSDPVVHYGIIASGNQVVKDSHLRDRLGRGLGAYCVEMEAAGLVNNYPCLVVRGICDYADSHKNKEWQGYAAAVAAAYGKELLLMTSDSSVNRKEIPSNARLAGRGHTDRTTAYLKMREQDCLRSLQLSNIDIPRLLHKGIIETKWKEVFGIKAYNEWYTGDGGGGLIWIKGKPGSGKSTFMKHAFCRAVEELRDTGASIAGFFFNG